jgi:hypothetical protein
VFYVAADEIRRVPKTGGVSALVDTVSSGTVNDIAVDGAFLYYSQSYSSTHTIEAIPKTRGARTQLLYESFTFGKVLALDAT